MRAIDRILHLAFLGMRGVITPVCLVAALVAVVPEVSQAEDVYEFVIRKQEKKESSRWTLEGWLAQRDRMRLMDLWLALHSPSPYEFYLGGEYRLFAPEGSAQVSGWNTHAAAYASIFGLEFSYSSLPSDIAISSQMQALFLLRIFGYHAQGTNITLQTGVRFNRGEAQYQSAVAGATMTIYLAKYFGIDGIYQHQFESTPNSSGGRISGSTFGGGAFIDFKFLRLYGQYRSHSQTTRVLAAESDSSSSEVVIGTRLFF